MSTNSELFKVEFKLFSRSFISMFFALIFPVMLLLLFGGIYGNEPTPFFNGYGSVDVSVPAYMGMILAVTGIMSLPLSVCGYREKKILKRFKATPLNPSQVILSQFLVNVIFTIISMILLIIVGVVVFDLHFMGNVLPMIFIFLLSLCSIFSIGFLIASIAPSMKAASAIANIIYFPMIFLTGATMPLEMMPNFMITISKFIPLTYAVDGLKKIWLGGSLGDITTDIIVLGGVLIVCTFVSSRLFKWE